MHRRRPLTTSSPLSSIFSQRQEESTLPSSLVDRSHWHRATTNHVPVDAAFSAFPAELGVITLLLRRYPVIFIDTEYMDTMHCTAMLFSLGIMLCNTVEPIWEFTFSDFNLHHSCYTLEFVAFLVSQGVDFYGVRSGMRSSVFAMTSHTACRVYTVIRRNFSDQVRGMGWHFKDYDHGANFNELIDNFH
ncbi:hypothetical protein HU200_049045 [Digitaria exilis]|uniref:Uncharacterized protein n=1 Tax=Digitaria exilis TaxID=1010633 RepID=A0A835AZN7_9POAL|nr:hypothetical protein HU200_049045 [Digitaria exilis]